MASSPPAPKIHRSLFEGGNSDVTKVRLCEKKSNLSSKQPGSNEIVASFFWSDRFRFFGKKSQMGGS
jgi:hypothetical protein